MAWRAPPTGKTGFFSWFSVVVLLRPPSLRAALRQPLKRLMDIVLAAALLLLAAPALALVTLAVRLDGTGGPVSYSHRRVGRGGCEFGCLKFRTMVPDAEAVLAALLARDPEARAAYLDLEMRRHRDMTIAAGWFQQRDRIRVDQLDVAADVLGLITGPDPWMHLTVARGWDVAAYRTWLTAQLVHLSDNLA